MIRAFLILLLSCVTLRAAAPFFYCPTTNELISIEIPPKNNRLVAWLSGLSTTNTTAGGLFVYNTNSAVAVDWLNYFKPANQNGRWERQLGIIPPARTITAGTGLTGGGDLSANRTIALANTAVTPDSYGSASQSAVIDVDQQGRITGIADATINIPASQVNSGATLTAGSGLTGTTAAALLAAATLNIGAGTGITVNADDVALSAGTQTSLGLANTAVQPARQIISGGGLTGGGDLSADRTLAVGAGTGITVNANDIAIADTAVTPDAYGSANQSAVITMNQQGQITVASDINIELDAARIISGTMATARLGSGTANNTTFLRGDQTWQTVSGSGTVTSVAMTVPGGLLTVSGSPVTTSGTLALTLPTQTANKFFASASSGGAATPAFRVMEQADLAAGLDVVPGAGDMLYSPIGDTWDKLVAGANGKVLQMAAGVPSWQTLAAAANVSRIYSKASETTIANTAATTTFFFAGEVGSTNIVMNTLAAGAQIRLKMGGYYTTKVLTPGNFSISFYLAGQTESITLSGFPANVSSTVGVWWAEYNWSIMTIGASGTVAGQGSFTYTNPLVTDAIFGGGAKRSSTNIDTTADIGINAGGTWATADSVNSITCEYATIELLNN